MLRSGLRFYARHPGQLVLTVLGIALGVAAVLSIDLAAHSSRQAFEASTLRLRGTATHELSRPGGEIPVALLAELRRELGIAESMPVLEGRLRFAAAPESSWPVIGIDPWSAARLGAQVGGGDLPAGSDFIDNAGNVWVSAGLAQRLSLAPGDALSVVDPVAGQLRVAAVLNGDEDEYLLADLATVEELLRRFGELSRIDLKLDDGGVAALRPLQARGYRLQTVSARIGQLDAVSRAFRINLQALSLLALLVGAFLVYSTVVFAIVRRHEQFGLMRCLGLRRREVFRLVLFETATLAVPATLLGILLGILMGAGLVSLVLRTLGDLYLIDTVDYYGVSPVLVAKAAVLGIGASLGAALLPAREAALMSPRAGLTRAALEGRMRRGLHGRLLMAAAACGLGTLLLLVTRQLELAFAGIFLLLIGIAVATPAGVYWLMGRLAAAFAAGRWLNLAYAARSVQANLSRTGPAVAALMIAVAAFTGIGVMVGSFRASVSDWLDYSLDADVLLRLDLGAASADLRSEVALLPGLRGITTSHRLRLPDGEGLAGLLVIEPDLEAGRWPRADGDREALLARMAGQEELLVSEAFARRRGIAVGDELTLYGRDGPRAWRIGGVFVDYSTDQGLVAMERGVFLRYFEPPDSVTLGLFAAPGQADTLLAATRRLVAERDELRVTSSAFLKEISLVVFDRTFTITQVLRLIAGLVAVIAIINALQAQRLDNRRETATLRAMGMRPGRLLLLSEMQTALLGGCAGLFALPVGLLLAWLLIVVVNRLAFGWNMMFLWQPGLLLQGLILAILAALAAGLWPARQALRTPPALALLEE